MKIIVFVILLITVQLSAFGAETVEQRLVKLERTVKAQSDSIETYKAKVAEIDLQKSFLSDIYNGNVSWFIGLVSLVIVLIIGYSVYSNKEDLKESKNNIETKIKELVNIFNSFKTDIISSFDKNTKEYKEHIVLFDKKLNDGLVSIYSTSSVFYTKYAIETNSLDVINKCNISIEALRAIIMYHYLVKQDNYNSLDSSFNRYIEIYKSTVVDEHHTYIKKMYLDHIYKIDIQFFSPEFQIYLKPKIQDVFLSLK